MKVRKGSNYISGEKKGYICENCVENCNLDDNTATLVGVDHYISKTCTLISEKVVDAHIILDMKFSISPTLRVALECKLTSDFPKLYEKLKLLNKSDTMVVCGTKVNFAVAGELHLKICLKDLEEDFMHDVKIKRIRVSRNLNVSA